MFGEVLTSILAVLVVGIIFKQATSSITKQIDIVAKELIEFKKEFMELMKTVIKIDSTYVTEEECSKRRHAGLCKKDGD
jgi:hypothetical protein